MNPTDTELEKLSSNISNDDKGNVIRIVRDPTGKISDMSNIADALDSSKDMFLRKKMSGAQKRKRKKNQRGLLALGVKEKQASRWRKKKLRKPFPANSTKSSRETGLSYLQTMNKYSVILVPSTYPMIYLNKAEVEELVAAIRERVDFGDSPPAGGLHFRGYYFERGALVLRCLDAETKEWVTRLVPHLEGLIGLKTTGLKILTHSVKACAVFPGANLTPELILERLKKQNPDLGTEDWSIEDLINVMNGYLAILKIPNLLPALEKNDFRVYYSLEEINIWLLGNHLSMGKPEMKDIFENYINETLGPQNSFQGQADSKRGFVSDDNCAPTTEQCHMSRPWYGNLVWKRNDNPCEERKDPIPNKLSRSREGSWSDDDCAPKAVKYPQSRLWYGNLSWKRNDNLPSQRPDIPDLHPVPDLQPTARRGSWSSDDRLRRAGQCLSPCQLEDNLFWRRRYHLPDQRHDKSDLQSLPERLPNEKLIVSWPINDVTPQVGQCPSPQQRPEDPSWNRNDQLLGQRGEESDMHPILDVVSRSRGDSCSGEGFVPKAMLYPPSHPWCADSSWKGNDRLPSQRREESAMHPVPDESPRSRGDSWSGEDYPLSRAWCVDSPWRRNDLPVQRQKESDMHLLPDRLPRSRDGSWSGEDRVPNKDVENLLSRPWYDNVSWRGNNHLRNQRGGVSDVCSVPIRHPWSRDDSWAGENCYPRDGPYTSPRQLEDDSFWNGRNSHLESDLRQDLCDVDPINNRWKGSRGRFWPDESAPKAGQYLPPPKVQDDVSWLGTGNQNDEEVNRYPWSSLERIPKQKRRHRFFTPLTKRRSCGRRKEAKM